MWLLSTRLLLNISLVGCHSQSIRLTVSLPAMTMVAAAPLMSSRSKALGIPLWALSFQMPILIWTNDGLSVAEA